MFRYAILFACAAACSAHAVLPLVHSVPTPVLVPIAPVAPYVHGYVGHGLLGYGYGAKPLGHHILKRSPHYVAPVSHLGGLGHVGLGHKASVAAIVPVAAVAPVAVSHQSRVDVRHSPAIVAAPVLPVVKPVIAPVLHGAPLLHKSLVGGSLAYGAGHYGVGHYGATYPHFGHY